MSELVEQQIGRILEKLEQVRKAGLTCFGSDYHKFLLNPTISESELAIFESEKGIKLPAGYRSFLRLAGDGGAGPDYGIYRLKEWMHFIDWVVDDLPSDILTKACPLYPGMSRDTDWESQFNGCLSPYQGTITIGNRGCSYMTGLIVTGEFAGRVVYLDADGFAPYVVHEPDFLSWYERWLNELLGGYDLFSFGYGITGTEASLMAMLDINTETTDSEGVDAVYAISRLPHLSPEGRRAICRLISDPVSDVCAGACYAAEVFEIQEASDLLVDRIEDESPAVQMAAIGAAMKISGATAYEKVVCQLSSNNPEVAKRAFSRLNTYRPIPRETLLSLIESSPHGSIRYYAAQGMDWRHEEEELLTRLLQDENALVRFTATLGLRRVGSALSLQPAIECLRKETDHNTIGSILRLLGEVPSEEGTRELLKWSANSDDDHRLSAIESLCKMGDDRALPLVTALLGETRLPTRLDDQGRRFLSSGISIGEKARELLRTYFKPNPFRRWSWLQWILGRKRCGQ